ncbi:putative leader peptide [Streptomyces sp. cg35]|uniref:putative leader peptide n=1 Tax=Streptomyces sp. cg35 TaxID=3421650 RepID=UPI003D16BADC
MPPRRTALTCDDAPPTGCRPESAAGLPVPAPGAEAAASAALRGSRAPSVTELAPPRSRGRPQCGPAVDRHTSSSAWSWIMQPRCDRTVTLVERRHVDLVRVASAICRCA